MWSERCELPVHGSRASEEDAADTYALSTLGAMLTGEVTLGRWLGAQTEKIDPLEQKGRCSLCRRVDGANLVWIR